MVSIAASLRAIKQDPHKFLDPSGQLRVVA
jgi:hypothetical protein